MTQAPTLVNGSETTAVGQIYIGPRPAAGIREVRRDLTVDGTRLGIDGIAGSAGILTIQAPVGLGGDPEAAYVSLHVLETSPHRSLAYLPIWDEGAEESDGGVQPVRLPRRPATSSGRRPSAGKSFRLGLRPPGR